MDAKRRVAEKAWFRFGWSALLAFKETRGSSSGPLPCP